MAAFTELGMMSEVCAGLEDMDWLLPTDVQQEAVPLILGGGDVLMAAETGSGKTGAFCLPVIQIVWETKNSGDKVGPRAASSTFVMSGTDRDPGFTVEGHSVCSPDKYKWQGGRSERGLLSGKHYYEVAITDNGLCRIGFATCDAYQELGKDVYGFGFGGTGKKSNGGNFDSYGTAFGCGDVMGCFLDLGEKTISYAKNGQYFDIAFDIPNKLHGEAFYVACTLKNSSLKFNFGDTPFTYPPKYGYKGVSKAGPEEILLKDRSATKKRSGPMALILEPSRELAEQTHRQIELFKKHLPSPGLKSCVIMGGENVKDQIALINQGVDIVTGTPGRLEDLIDTGSLKLENVRFFILDEADGLLQQAQKDLILKMYDRMDKLIDGRRLQLIVCSATLHNFEVKKLAEQVRLQLIVCSATLHNFEVKKLAEQVRLQLIVCSATLHNFEVKKLAEQVRLQLIVCSATLHNFEVKKLAEQVRLQLIVCSATLHNFEVKKLAEQVRLQLIVCSATLHNYEVKKLAEQVRLQLIVCSATLHNFEVKKLAEQVMHFPTWVDLKGSDVVPETVHHVVCYVDPETDRSHQSLTNKVRTDGVHVKDVERGRDERMSEAVKLLKAEYFVTAVEQLQMYNEQCIVFCRTKLDCDNLEKYLNSIDSKRYSCVCLHGDRRVPERKANLQSFKDKQAKFLICTDVAARGIDVKGVPFVINYTLPDETLNFIHRMGRVGRAERMGLAISLAATTKEKVWYHSNCSNRGKGCYNTNLTDYGGCCIWYDEMKLMKDLEEYIDSKLPEVNKSFAIPTNEFDGKVTYGEKRKGGSGGAFYQGHAQELSQSVKELYELEKRAQISFMNMKAAHPILS